MTDQQGTEVPEDPEKVKAAAAILAMAFLLGTMACGCGIACFGLAWWLNT